MKHKALCLAVVSILAVSLVSAWGAGTGLPFEDDFESAPSGGALNTNTWYSSTTGVARTENTYSNGYLTVDGSDQAAYVSDELSFLIDTGMYGPYTNVWCSYYTKVTPSASVPSNLDSSTVAGLYVNTDGDVVAFSGSGWTTVETSVATSPWIGFAVHLDYTTDKWDVYKTPESFSYGDALDQLNTDAALDLNALASAVEEFSRLDVEGTTYLENLNLNEDTIPANDSSPSNAVDAAEDVVLGENLTGVLTKYFTAANSKLSGPLGKALSSALLATDIVYIYTPDDGGWQTYTCSGPGNGFTHTSGGGSAGLNLTITPTMAVFVEHVATGERAPARLTAYNTPQQPGDSVTIFGSGAGGWTAMAVPFGAGSVSIAGLGFPAPAGGDQLWIKRLQGGYEVPIYYDGSNWKRGPTIVDGMLLAEGQAFWYRRNAAGNATWDADAALDVN